MFTIMGYGKEIWLTDIKFAKTMIITIIILCKKQSNKRAILGKVFYKKENLIQKMNIDE